MIFLIVIIRTFKAKILQKLEKIFRVTQSKNFSICTIIEETRGLSDVTLREKTGKFYILNSKIHEKNKPFG